jgi:hypothetical protein
MGREASRGTEAGSATSQRTGDSTEASPLPLFSRLFGQARAAVEAQKPQWRSGVAHRPLPSQPPPNDTTTPLPPPSPPLPSTTAPTSATVSVADSSITSAYQDDGIGGGAAVQTEGDLKSRMLNFQVSELYLVSIWHRSLSFIPMSSSSSGVSDQLR